MRIWISRWSPPAECTAVFRRVSSSPQTDIRLRRAGSPLKYLYREPNHFLRFPETYQIHGAGLSDSQARVFSELLFSDSRWSSVKTSAAPFSHHNMKYSHLCFRQTGQRSKCQQIFLCSISFAHCDNTLAQQRLLPVKKTAWRKSVNIRKFYYSYIFWELNNNILSMI